MRSALANLLPALTSQGIALLTFLTNVLLTPLLAFYLLRDWHTLLASVERLLPPRWRAGVTSLCGQIDHMVGEYLRGRGRCWCGGVRASGARGQGLGQRGALGGFLACRQIQRPPLSATGKRRRAGSKDKRPD